MLGNQIELWETMLAAMKLGAVIIPATTLLAEADLRDRIDRGNARHVVVRSADAAKFDGVPGDYSRIAVGDAVDGWLPYADAYQAPEAFAPDGATNATDTLLLYFTSGTTARPKLVEHTHASYPVGHLSTMYWLGLKPGDVHLNLSSPGWAKHAWSNFFAPWLAEATVAIFNYERFDATRTARRDRHPRDHDVLRAADRVADADPGRPRLACRPQLREVVGAGEPLNPEIIERVKQAWGLTLRDGYGQTETTAQIGNTPGQPLKPGSMGRPLPGYEVVLVDPATGEPADEGEICLDLSQRPLGLMVGYRDDDERTSEAMSGGYYHTGDVASRDADGYITYVGRTDDVFKASDYRISPFELESVLIEHEAVAEAAVVPVARSAAAGGAEGVRRARRGVRTRPRHRAVDPAPLARAPRAVQADPPDRVHRAAEDDQRQDPARRAARATRSRINPADSPKRTFRSCAPRPVRRGPRVGGRAALSLRAGRLPRRARRHGPEGADPQRGLAVGVQRRDAPGGRT